MEQPYLGEIRVFAGSQVPTGWAPCDGQTLSASEYPDLAQALGGAFGSTSTTFNLPDLRGRLPLGAQPNTRPTGFSGGEEAVNPTSCASPHTHTVFGSGSEANRSNQPDSLLCAMEKTQRDQKLLYSSTPPSSTSPRYMDELSVSFTGGSQPHNNMQPSLVLNFCISLTGKKPKNCES